MANIKIALAHSIFDGQPLSFKAPCNCTEVSGIKVEYPDGDGTASTVFSFADAHGNELAGIGNLFVAGTMVRVILDTESHKAYIQNADTNGYIENTFAKKSFVTDSFSMKKPVYIATPSNLTTIILTAEPGSTIKLEAGNYSLLKLTGNHLTVPGYTPYPENLTITGTHDAKIEGVSITSGIKDQTVHSAYPRNSEYGCVNPDISDAILPQGLTFKSVSFYNSFSLRNGRIDNLTFDDCQFVNGSFINVDPNRMEDLYGKDYTNENDINFQDRPYYATLIPKNLVVRDCKFNGTHPTSDLSAIRIQSVDGITIYRNYIEKARFNGVNIGGVSNPLNDSYSTGKISISNNRIRNTNSRSIRLYTIRDADVLIAANDLWYANKTETSNREVIKASGCVNTTITFTGRNTYNNSGISEGNRITLQNCSTPVVESAEYPGCYFRTVNSETEWVNPPMISGMEYRTTERYKGVAVYKKVDNDGNILWCGENETSWHLLTSAGVFAERDCLTLTNIGNCRLSYAIDSKTLIADLKPGESVKLTNVKSYVYCSSEFNWNQAASTFENCTVEWTSRDCTITLTGGNAVANVYAYD